MPTKKKKQPKDTFQIAREIVEAAIGEPLKPVPPSGRPPGTRKSNRKK
jgi:hypothetical protein